MTQIRAPKKSETLEIRLDHRTKQAFMARCRRQGSTASEAVRRFIEAEAAGSRPARSGLWRLAGAAAAGLALGAAAAPSLAQSSDHEAFARLDQNGDRLLSFDEFSRR